MSHNCHSIFCNLPCLGRLPKTIWSYVPKLDIFKCVVVSLFKNVHEYFLVVKSILVLFSSSAIMPSEFHGQRLTHMLDCAASTVQSFQDSGSSAKEKNSKSNLYCENQTNKDDLLPDWPGFASGL